MARFEGIPLVTGTIGPVCIYKMHGHYFMRSRSSLTGERVKRDPVFHKTLQYATLLGKASKIGSAVYALLPAAEKQHALYRKLTREAMTWLKYGWQEADVLEWLQKRYTSREVILFHVHLEEQKATAKSPETEQQAIACFKVHLKSLFTTHPPAGRLLYNTRSTSSPGGSCLIISLNPGPNAPPFKSNGKSSIFQHTKQ